jgi:cell division protein ZipA
VDIKSWILIGGGLLLIAVIAHGFWLAWRNRRNTLRLDIDPNIPQDDVDPLELLRGELPNGGARVRTVTQQETFAFSAGHPAGGDAAPAARTAPGVGTTRSGTRAPASERGTAATLTTRASDRIGARPVTRPPRESDPAPVADVPALTLDPSPAAPGADERIIGDAPRVSEATASADAPRAASGRTRETQTSHAQRKETVPDEVVVINVLARRGESFRGTGLMEVFMRNGLKFGDMNIFHRVHPASRSPQFSIASAVEPGTFDVAAMEQFETRGVCLFMPLPQPGPSQPLAVFEDMLTVARDLAKSLGGDLKDEGHSVMTAQSIEHCRQRITEFSRRQLSRH